MELVDALRYVEDKRNGVLVTARRDGRPQLSNITFLLGDDGAIRISVTASRAKAKNMARDPAISLHVTAPDFWSYVVFEGEAELSEVASAPDDSVVDELVELYRGLAGEHENWDEYRAAMVADGRLVVRLRPHRVYGMLPASS